MDYGLALLSGVLLALSFPKFGHPAFAWIALVPLLIALAGWRRAPKAGARVRNGADELGLIGAEGQGATPQRAFRLGLISGIVYFVGTTYWTGEVLQQFGGVPMALALLAMLLLALLPRAVPRVDGAHGGVSHPRRRPTGVVSGAGRVGGHRVPARIPVRRLSVGPARQQPGHGPARRAAGQRARRLRPLGAGGVRECRRSRIALLAAGRAADRRARRGGPRAGRRRGLGRLADRRRIADARGHAAPGRPRCRATSRRKTSGTRSEARRIFTTYLAMTRDAVRRGAEFVIWPESSTPFMFEEDDVGEAAVRDLARELGVPILFGSDQVDRARQPHPAVQRRVPVTPEGETGGRLPEDPPRAVRRIHPVQGPGCTFVSPLVERLRRFAPGDVDGHAAGRLAPGRAPPSATRSSIPSLIREAVLGGSELLTTITNDGWYGSFVRAVPALRDGVDAGDRAGPLPRARRQHRHQRHRRSVRARGAAVGYL